MTRTLTIVLGGAALLALQVSPQAPEIPEITGARVALVPKTAAGAQGHDRESAGALRWSSARSVLTRPGQSAPFEFHTRYFSDGAFCLPPDSSPLQPNAQRVLDLVLRNDTEIQTVTLTLAVFADGFAEGAPSALETWRKGRRAQTDDLTYWVRAFDAMPRISEPDVRAYLAARLLERAREASTDPSNVRGRLQRVLQRVPVRYRMWDSARSPSRRRAARAGGAAGRAARRERRRAAGRHFGRRADVGALRPDGVCRDDREPA